MSTSFLTFVSLYKSTTYACAGAANRKSIKKNAPPLDTKIRREQSSFFAVTG